MHDLVIVGAGPGGIALAAEAHACKLEPGRVVVLEKGSQHNWAIRQFYPEKKLTTANYKGFQAQCQGLLCIRDMTKAETLEYFDRVIADYRIDIQYNTEVFSARREQDRFSIDTSKGRYESKEVFPRLVRLAENANPAARVTQESAAVRHHVHPRRKRRRARCRRRRQRRRVRGESF